MNTLNVWGIFSSLSFHFFLWRDVHCCIPREEVSDLIVELAERAKVVWYSSDRTFSLQWQRAHILFPHVTDVTGAACTAGKVLLIIG